MIAALSASLAAVATVAALGTPSPTAIEDRRAAVRATVTEDLGVPSAPCSADTSYSVVGTTALTGYTRKDILYNSCGDQVPAYLLIPDGSGPFPGIVAMHQTTNVGRDEVAGISGSASLAYGLELVQRGFVVIAPDTITTGDRVIGGKYFDTSDLYAAHPDWSAMGKMLQDHKAAVSVLQSLLQVNANRIGSIGHSLGAHNSLFLAAFDDRVKAAVANAGYERMATDTNRERWSRADNDDFIYFPSLREYLEPGSNLPLRWDFEDILLLVGQRPVFQSFGLQDTGWTIPTSGLTAENIVINRTGYDTVQTVFFTGGHEFPLDTRLKAYTFLDGALKGP